MTSINGTTNETNRIRGAADLLAIAGNYLQLKKCGLQYRGLCPFHQEKSPSFYLHPGKQLWHCHGCGAGGDVFSFIQQIEHCDFPKALQIVADYAGVPFEKRPLTREEGRHFAGQARYRELIEHFRLHFGVTEELAPRYFKWSCQADPGFREWLEDDLNYVHAITACIVSLLARAQQRDGDFPEQEKAA